MPLDLLMNLNTSNVNKARYSPAILLCIWEHLITLNMRQQSLWTAAQESILGLYKYWMNRKKQHHSRDERKKESIIKLLILFTDCKGRLPWATPQQRASLSQEGMMGSSSPTAICKMSKRTQKLWVLLLTCRSVWDWTTGCLYNCVCV